MKKRFFALMGILAVAFIGYLAFTAVDSKTSTVIAAKAYNATVYVAGHGGHFAKAEVTVDPSSGAIKVNSLDKIDIGDTKTHKTHDARVDSENSSTLFWSTYALDPQGKMHVGKSDLKTGKVITDLALDPDKRAPGKTGPLYCASGQSKKDFMPVFMGKEGYIDVFDKATMKHKHRVFISDIGYKPESYMFLHGINSHDMKKFVLAVTMIGADGKPNGKNDILMVDLPSLENGKLKELARTTLTGEPGKTITFRQFFSSDDKLVFQSAGDRMYVIDAATLKVVDEKMTPGQVHDVMPSPDGKFALMTLRTTDTPGCDPEGKPLVPEKKITDGVLNLYDVDAKKIVGKNTTVCFGCHKGMGLGDKSAILCGLDAIYKK